MALSTYKTFLMIKKAGESASSDPTWEELVPIKNVPALGAERNTIDTTTLRDDTEQLMPGIKRVGDGYQFTCNYDQDKYYEIDQMDGEVHDFAIWKGGTGSGSNVTPTGSDGKWEVSGRITVGTADGDVDAAFDMTVTIFPSSPMAYSKGTST